MAEAAATSNWRVMNICSPIGWAATSKSSAHRNMTRNANQFGRRNRREEILINFGERRSQNSESPHVDSYKLTARSANPSGLDLHVRRQKGTPMFPRSWLSAKVRMTVRFNQIFD